MNTPLQRQGEQSNAIRQGAIQYAEAMVYSLDNPYTTDNEKIAVEVWYQSPIEIGGYAFLICAFLSPQFELSVWQLFWIPNLVSMIAAALYWYAYNPSVMAVVGLFLLAPFISWPVHLGTAAWFLIQGRYWAALLACTAIPFGIGGILFNSFASRRYKMHQKYAFLKRNFGIQFPFEDRSVGR